MAIDEAVRKEVTDLAGRLNRQKKEKAQPINAGYRGGLYYENLFKQMDKDDAYREVVVNLKAPSFGFEREVAVETYERVYGEPFRSRDERIRDEQVLEIERLKAELAAAKAEKTTVTDDGGDALDPTEWPKGMDKEAFKVFFTEWFEKSQGVRPNGGQQSSAWNKYIKRNENPA